MTVKKFLSKVAKEVRKTTKCDFVKSIEIAKWLTSKKDFSDYKKIGIVCVLDFDANCDWSDYTYNGVSLSSCVLKAKESIK